MTGQTQRRRESWPPHQVAAFANVVTRLAFGRETGAVSRSALGSGRTPTAPDNPDRLRSLPTPFMAHDMTQNGADSDGLLEPTAPVVTWRLDEHQATRERRRAWSTPPSPHTS